MSMKSRNSLLNLQPTIKRKQQPARNQPTLAVSPCLNSQLTPYMPQNLVTTSSVTVADNVILHSSTNHLACCTSPTLLLNLKLQYHHLHSWSSSSKIYKSWIAVLAMLPPSSFPHFTPHAAILHCSPGSFIQHSTIKYTNVLFGYGILNSVSATPPSEDMLLQYVSNGIKWWKDEVPRPS